MAHVRKGLLTPAPEWWKHLKRNKRRFWHRERLAAKRDVRGQLVTASWDVTDYLDSEEAIAAYLVAAREEADPALMVAAEEDVERARKRWSLN